MARALYSTLILDLKTEPCFLKDQKIGLASKKTVTLEVDILSSQSPPNQHLQILERKNHEEGLKIMSWQDVPLRYQGIFLTAIQCDCLGALMN